MTETPARQGVRAYPSIDAAWRRLAEYLGADFDPALMDFARCCESVEAEFAQLGQQFYEHSVGYMYELTHFHYSTYKDPFFDVVTHAASGLDLRHLADVGCGVGLDAQALATLGYQLCLFEMDCPSVRYAAWRLAQDGHPDVPIRKLDKLGLDRFDLVYAVDVLEHLADPVPMASRLFDAGRYVCVNFFEHDPSPWDGRDMHFPLDHWNLLPEFSRRGELVQLAISGATVTALWRGRE